MKKLYLALIILLSLPALAEGPGTRAVVTAGSKNVENIESETIGSLFKNLTSNTRLTNSNSINGRNSVNTVQTHESCEELNNPVCDIITAGPPDHMKVGISFLKFRSLDKQTQTPKDCDCLKDKLQGGTSDEAFLVAKKKEREEVNKKILASYGKKFVNNLAINLEDMSFFLNQTSVMFSDRGKAIELQCMEPSLFNAKVKETCGKKNITDEAFIESRKDMFINSVSGEMTSFNYKMPSLANEILSSSKSTDFDSRDEDSSGNVNSSTLSRFQYDQLRMDLAMNDPQAKFMDRLIGNILKNANYTAQVNENLNNGLDPVGAMMKVVGDNLDKFDVAKDEKKYLESAGALEDSFKFFMKVHPGVGLALSDYKAFENVRKVVKPGSNETFLNTLNNTTNVLEPVLVERCHSMIEEFAKAVCTADDEIIASVDPDDLELLLHQTDDRTKYVPINRGTELHELLICEAKIVRKAATSATIFSGIGVKFGGSVRDSDYISKSASRSGMLIGHSMMGHFNLAAAKNSALRGELGNMIDRNNQTRKGFTGPGIAVNKVYAEEVLKGQAMSLGNSSMTKEDARKFIAENKKWEEKRAAEVASNLPGQKTGAPQVASKESEIKTSPQNSVQPQNIAGPQTNTMMVPNYSTPQPSTTASKQAEQSREQLRQYLADKNGASESAKAVSALDDSSVQELNRLRNERQMRLEQELKDGEARLSELRTQLSNAASKVQSPVPDRHLASVDDEVKEFSNSETSSGRNPRFIDQRASMGGQVTGNQFAASPVGTSTGNSQAGSTPVASSKISQESAPSETQVANSPVVQSDSGSIVITASDVKASEKLPAQELNQEVQKFLAGTDLNTASIQDIKSKGIKIRFNVMENNKLVQKEVVVMYENLDRETRNQIDLKLARKNVQNQVSKLAVLRMLIKQNNSL